MTDSYLTPEELTLLKSSRYRPEPTFVIKNVSQSTHHSAKHYGSAIISKVHYTYIAEFDELVRNDIMFFIQRTRKEAKQKIKPKIPYSF
jgi:hypothetical protein